MIIYVKNVLGFDMTFPVMVDGWLHHWPLERIKYEVSRGAELREWV